MGKIIESTDVDAIYDAIRTGEISLEDVEARFVDLKISFQQGTQNIDFNDRNKDKKSCWLELTDAEREQVVEGCSFPAFENPIERWIAYSLLPKFALMRGGQLWHNYAIDCDGSKSADMVPTAVNALYRALWPDVPADSADTMNSFWTTYKRSLRLLDVPLWHSAVKEGILSEIIDEDGHLRSEFSELDTYWRRSIMRKLEMLAYLTHTIGDFIPCGGAFNTGRYAPTLDYWDITLEFVRDWYLNRQGVESSSEMPDTTFNSGILTSCREWLDHFGNGVEGWNNFVKQNYLDAYMQVRFVQGGGCELEKDEQGAYIVEPFYSGHDFAHPQLAIPPDAIIALTHMNAAIIARGNQMVAALGDDPCAKLFVK